MSPATKMCPRQAFDEAFELDLRSTALADFSEAQELFYAGKLKQTRFFGQTYEAKGGRMVDTGRRLTSKSGILVQRGSMIKLLWL